MDGCGRRSGRSRTPPPRRAARAGRGPPVSARPPRGHTPAPRRLATECGGHQTGYAPAVHAEVVMLQTLLEGAPLPAKKHDLIRYAQEQGESMPWNLLDRLTDREYRTLDEVGEALAPVQVRDSNADTPLPHAESGLPPGAEDYVTPFPLPGGVRHDAPPDNPPQKAIEQQTKRQNEQKERQEKQLGD